MWQWLEKDLFAVDGVFIGLSIWLEWCSGTKKQVEQIYCRIWVMMNEPMALAKDARGG